MNTVLFLLSAESVDTIRLCSSNVSFVELFRVCITSVLPYCGCDMTIYHRTCSTHYKDTTM